MSDEKNYEIKEVKNNCFYQSKCFKKFIVVATGSFVGVFCALSLFAALHKPPVMPCPMAYHMMRPGCPHMQHFYKHHKKPFHKNFDKRNFDKRIPVNVNIENKE